ncbi:MAG: molybdopterin-dependent oxidoreductase, partial [Planctomycetales bacterium]|nr:molybdopterin-dependent oxidoreductase [Planctomycetales bacterium]NIP71375.1 molybdopterin-dependent oxidoreductase [Planctomycetales bacterium]
EAAAKRFRWTERRRAASPREGVGIACGTEKGSFVAACAAVHVETDGTIKVDEVCQAYECGAIHNPANLLAQVEGCLIMGLGGALREEIHFSAGKV